MAGIFGPVEVVGGIALATGVGQAVGDTVTPKLQDYQNARWRQFPNKPLPASTIAEAVAEALANAYANAAEASNTGINADRFDLLVELSKTAPGVPELLIGLRRGTLNAGNVAHGFRKARLEPMWDDFLVDLQHERLDPAVIANAIVRGIMDAPFPLPVPPPSGTGKVPAFPRSSIDSAAEAAASGVDVDRLFVMTAIDGRPMSPEGAAAATFKGIIERIDYDRAISEGDVRNEWADAIFENSRPIPHPLDYVQAHLRGWRTLDEMHAGAERSGMRDPDTDLLFLIHGRPLSWHQVFIGLRRGGTYDGPTDIIDPAFLKALRESDIRPEWYNLAWAQRFTYPTAFVLRSLTQSGDITQAESEQILLYEGWEPTLAAQVSTKWAGGTSASGTAGPDVKKAQSSLFTATHRSYVARESGDPEARAALTSLGVSAADQDAILNLWGAERTLIHRQLTPAQIRKAVKGAVINPATGVAWTTADAMTALLARGYDSADATTFLAEA